MNIVFYNCDNDRYFQFFSDENTARQKAIEISKMAAFDNIADVVFNMDEGLEIDLDQSDEHYVNGELEGSMWLTGRD